MHFVFFRAWPGLWSGLTFTVGHIQLNYKNPGQFDIFSSMSCRDLVTPWLGQYGTTIVQL